MQLTKREFIKTLAVSFAVATIAPASIMARTLQQNVKSEDTMAFTLPDLPYAQNALEPHISATTMGIHHGKHHNAYVTNLNNLVKDTEFATMSLEEVIKKSAGDSGKVGIFNNAAQIWNHTFFWNSMKPAGGGKPTGKIAEKIEKDLGGYDAFKEAFKQAAATQFGSGWAWLVLDKGVLKITKTGNAELPMTSGQTALLTLDVWEHAYYLDYQNRRPDFITTFIENLINWDFAEANLAKAA